MDFNNYLYLYLFVIFHNLICSINFLTTNILNNFHKDNHCLEQTDRYINILVLS